MDGEKLVQNIRAIAIQKGIQMKDLYIMAGITSGALSQWKSGKTKPHTATLSRIADSLKVTMQELLEGTDKAPSADKGEERYAMSDGEIEEDAEEFGEFMRIIRLIPPEERPRAKAILTALLPASGVPSGSSSKAP